MLSKSTYATLSLLLPIVSSQLTQVVAVGENGLVFTPSTITAPVGSQVEFQFYPRNHSVVSSAFDNPCQPDGKLFSGYMPVSAGTGPDVFVITINDTNPIWYYCSQNVYV
ncbi:hypothetical protein LTR56_002634 [Elasticomyces elasticus]|nr:hypothetical protein LTR22_021666 [Elasticomyces elasticus]KAK3657120.1 hypothetical protein LTR56_002634 [Elasticomyces elasticus]KAK4905529.1 hypothetical protein LTR49_025204 [Elasticomyces elasticus]KAK5742765.1 hypothetical protein LTS12_024084 [Elasticomyces elasticus]